MEQNTFWRITIFSDQTTSHVYSGPSNTNMEIISCSWRRLFNLKENRGYTLRTTRTVCNSNKDNYGGVYTTTGLFHYNQDDNVIGPTNIIATISTLYERICVLCPVASVPPTLNYSGPYTLIGSIICLRHTGHTDLRSNNVYAHTAQNKKCPHGVRMWVIDLSQQILHFIIPPWSGRSARAVCGAGAGSSGCRMSGRLSGSERTITLKPLLLLML